MKNVQKVKCKQELYLSRSHPTEIKVRGLTPDPSLLLLGELFFTDVSTTELNVEHALHGTEHLLVRRGAATLKVLDDGDGGVALGGEFLLGHLVPFIGAALLDRISHLEADGLGLDDVVAAVDLGQVLAFGGA